MERATTLPASPPTELLPATSREHSRRVRTRLMEAGLHDGATWRISPTPFLLTSADLSAIQSLGPHLLRFTHALNRLYYESVRGAQPDRKSTRLNSSHGYISYAVFCLKKKKTYNNIDLYDVHEHIRANHSI